MDLNVQSDTTRRFMAALLELEQSRDPAPMAQLFTGGAPVESIDGLGPRQGPDGITALFTTYLDQFEQVRATFTQATEGESRAALEWSTSATLRDGRHVDYTGVTVIDLADDRVSGFRTLFDSAALLDRPGADGSGAAARKPSRARSVVGTPTSGHTGADSGLLDEANRDASDGTVP